jgi:uncharacterized membrane protein YfcA
VEYLILIVAAFMAGLMNAIAGGGSFFVFPALVFAGVPPINANASTTVALFPSTFASAWAYRRDLRDFGGVRVRSMLIVSLVGGSTGAALLLSTSAELFDAVIPWLLLGSTVIFAFGPRLASILEGTRTVRPSNLLLAQFLTAVYGGYFGGAVGLVMLAAWSLFGVSDIRIMNANRTLLGGSLNAAAVVLFVIAQTVWWPQTLLMVVFAIAGAYTGARLVLRMNPAVARLVVLLVATGVTIAFFIR